MNTEPLLATFGRYLDAKESANGAPPDHAAHARVTQTRRVLVEALGRADKLSAEHARMIEQINRMSVQLDLANQMATNNAASHSRLLARLHPDPENLGANLKFAYDLIEDAMVAAVATICWAVCLGMATINADNHATHRYYNLRSWIKGGAK